NKSCAYIKLTINFYLTSHKFCDFLTKCKSQPNTTLLIELILDPIKFLKYTIKFLFIYTNSFVFEYKNKVFTILIYCDIDRKSTSELQSRENIVCRLLLEK